MCVWEEGGGGVRENKLKKKSANESNFNWVYHNSLTYN